MFKIFDFIKLPLLILLQIKEASGPNFFSGPNFYWGYNTYISYRYFFIFRKLIKVSPLSRFYHGIIDEKAKLIVYTSPKSASTTVKEFAYNNLNLVNLNGVKTYAQDVDLPTLLGGKNNECKEIPFLLYYTYYPKTYQSYCILREPYKRLTSLYKDKFINLMKFYNNSKDFTSTNSLILTALAQVQLHCQPNIPSLKELTFNQLITALHRSFNSKNGKVWEYHFTAQITPDFLKVAANHCVFLNISQTNDLLENWYYKHHGKVNDLSDFNFNKSNTKESTRFLKNAWNIPLEQLVELDYSISSESFYNAQLEILVNDIYEADYYYWAKTKDYVHNF